MSLSNNADAFRVLHNMMLTTGLWPVENASWIYNIKTMMSWLSMVSLSITMWIEFFTDISDLSKVSQILYILVTFLSAIVKQAAFFYYRKTFISLLNHLKDPLFTSYPEGFDYFMVKAIQQSTFIAKSYQFLVGCCVVLMGVFPLFDGKPLPFPFPYDFGRYRFLMYAYQLFCLSISAWNNSCMDSLCTSFMGIASAQLDILMNKIRYIAADKDSCGDNIGSTDNELVTEKLKQCVNHHLAIIDLVKYTEKIFNIGIFAQYLASGVVICNVLFHFLLISVSIQFLMLVNYLVIVLIQLYIYCWYGNQISVKAEEVANACYTFNWYDYGTPVRQCIFLIMERSQKPLRITALKLFSASIESLTSILQWSYSMLTVLRQLYNNQTKYLD